MEIENKTPKNLPPAFTPVKLEVTIQSYEEYAALRCVNDSVSNGAMKRLLDSSGVETVQGNLASARILVEMMEKMFAETFKTVEP
jgi:hypothetical protein